MKSYVYILYKLAWAAGMLPPDAVAAMLLVSLGAPSAVAAFLAGLPWILDLLLGGVVTGYLKGLLGYHIWREIPPVTSASRSGYEIELCSRQMSRWTTVEKRRRPPGLAGGSRVGDPEGLYPLYCREEEFSETGFPISGVLGNSVL